MIRLVYMLDYFMSIVNVLYTPLTPAPPPLLFLSSFSPCSHAIVDDVNHFLSTNKQFEHMIVQPFQYIAFETRAHLYEPIIQTIHAISNESKTMSIINSVFEFEVFNITI